MRNVRLAAKWACSVLCIYWYKLMNGVFGGSFSEILGLPYPWLTTSLALWLRHSPWEEEVRGCSPGQIILSELTVATQVTILSDAWCQGFSAGTGWSGVSMLWLDQTASLISKLCVCQDAKLSKQVCSFDTILVDWPWMEYTNMESWEWRGVEEAGCKIYSGAPMVSQTMG